MFQHNVSISVIGMVRYTVLLRLTNPKNSPSAERRMVFLTLQYATAIWGHPQVLHEECIRKQDHCMIQYIHLLFKTELTYSHYC